MNQVTYSNGKETYTIIGDYNTPTIYEVVAVNDIYNECLILGYSEKKTKRTLCNFVEGNKFLCDAIERTTGWDGLNDEWSYDGKTKSIDFGGGWLVKYGNTVKKTYAVKVLTENEINDLSEQIQEKEHEIAACRHAINLGINEENEELVRLLEEKSVLENRLKSY